MPENTEHYLLSKQALQKIPGFKYHKGLMGKFEIPSFYSDIGQLDPPFLFLDGLTSAENMGVICRTASGFGVKNIILSADCTHPFLRRSVRVSMGGIFDLNFIRVDDSQSSLMALKRRNIKVIGLEQDSRSIALSKITTEDQNICLIVGSEDTGVRAEVLDSCDIIAEIGHTRSIDSLNVAQAATLGIYSLLTKSFK